MDAGCQERQVAEAETPGRIAFREALEAAQARGRAYGGVLAQLELARRAAEDPAGLVPVAPRDGGGTDRLSLVAGQMKFSSHLVARVEALTAAHARDEARLKAAEQAVARLAEDPELQPVFAADAKLDELFAAFKDAEADFADYPALLTLLRNAEAPPEPSPEPAEDLGPFLFRRPADQPARDPAGPAADPAWRLSWMRWGPLAIAVPATAAAALGLPPTARGLADGLLAAGVLAAVAWGLRAGGTTPSPAVGPDGGASPDDPQDDAQDPDVGSPEAIMERLRLPSLTLELGLDLIPLVDPTLEGQLISDLHGVREALADELGLVVPGVQFKDNLTLKANSYRFLRRGQLLAEGEVEVGSALAIAVSTTDTTDPLVGLETTDPVDQRPAFWVAAAEAERARRFGYVVWSPTSVVLEHVSETIRAHAGEILFLDSVAIMCNRMREHSLIMDEVVGFGPSQPNRLELAELHQVLQLLLAERVSIRDFAGIIEALAHALRPARAHHYGDMALFHDHLKTPDMPNDEKQRRLAQSLAPETTPHQLLQLVRRALARQLSAGVADADRRIHALQLRPGVADALHDAVRRNPAAPERALAADTRDRLVRSLQVEVEGAERPVIICDPAIRWAIRRLTAQRLPKLQVLALDEIDPAYEVVVTSQVALVET